MIVACPNCQTRFNVSTAALQPDGRQVRCSQCHYSWFQTPQEAEAPPARPAAPRRPASPRPATPPPVAQAPTAQAPTAQAPTAQAPTAQAPTAQAYGPESDMDDFQAGAIADESPPDWDEPEVDTGPEPGSYDLEDLEGEPIPQLPIQTRARAQQRRRAQKKSKAAMGWYALVAAIAGVLALLYFARAELVELWPPMERLYVTAGIDLPLPPLTLEFRDTATSFEDDDTTLVVAGRVLNSGAAPQAVPPVEVVLLDSTGTTLVTRSVRPDNASLQPGAETGFSVRFVEFPPAVADLRLSFLRDDR